MRRLSHVRTEVAFALLSAPGAALGFGSVFIYQPGAVAPVPPVYNAWPTLYARWSKVPGPKLLQVDTSLQGFAPAVIPAGVWNLDSATITARNEDVLSFAEGAHIDPAALFITFRGAVTVSADGSTPVWNPSNLFALLLMLEESFLKSTNAPFFRASAGDGSLSLQVTQDSFLGDAIRPVITVDAASKIDILPHSGATIENHALAGLGDADIHASSDVALSLVQDITTLTVTHVSLASLTDYSPASLPNWSNVKPTSVANALDRIAAHLGPIP